MTNPVLRAEAIRVLARQLVKNHTLDAWTPGREGSNSVSSITSVTMDGIDYPVTVDASMLAEALNYLAALGNKVS
jgi:hypothetical protein